MSDKALAKHLGEFIKHHRIEQNITQENLAKDAAISRSTLSLLERGENVSIPILIKVLRVLDQLHIMEIFSIEKKISPIKLAKLEEEKRHRASTKKNKNQSKSNW